MLKLTPEDISLYASATDKADAINQIAALMAEAGLVDKAYLNGMLAREQQTSTYLGNGIAIPHGTTDTRHLIHKTGIRVMRFPDGIAWSNETATGQPEQLVYTAIGIAAKSDEHLAILRQLTRVIGDGELAKRLHQSEDPEEVRRILAGEATAGAFLLELDHIRLQAEVSCLMEAAGMAGGILFNKKAAGQDDLPALSRQSPIHLGEGVWLSTVMTKAPNGCAVIIQPAQPFMIDTQPLKLFIAIATHNADHLPLLDKLSDLSAQGALAKLTDARRAVDLVRLLVASNLKGKQVVCRLPMEHGLHARPAATLARMAKAYDDQIWVENLDGSSAEVSAQSVTKLISLGAGFADRLRITMDGPDADAALSKLCEAIAGGLGDPVMPLPKAHSTRAGQRQDSTVDTLAEAAQAAKPIQAGETVSGLAGAPGVAIGKAHILTGIDYTFVRRQGPPAGQVERLKHAVQQVSAALRSRLDKSTNTELAQIIAMHMELVSDPELRKDAERNIKTGDSAEWAWQQSFEALAQAQEKRTELLLAERAIDIRDVGNSVLGELTGQGMQIIPEYEHILVCQELTPTEISGCDPATVKAIVSAGGGVTSHVAILARSLGIPLLAGCGSRVLTITTGTSLIVDCEHRQVIVAPSDEVIAAAQTSIEKERQRAERERADRMAHAETRDGHRIEIMANLTAAKAVEAAIENGCEGVGLFRSEFIYLRHAQEPTIEQQIAEYSKVLDALGPDRPLIVRTLDIGGDKPLPYMPMEEEENPFLGIRGVRLSLKYPDTLRHQLHALLRAADSRPLRIMFPMVTDLPEWRRIKAIYNEVAIEYPSAQIELGIMIEVPSAALMAEAFAPELDFFSVGTNDLTQYTLAIDRGHSELSRQADALSPAVLRLIKMTVDAADRHGIWVGVCGELASDPLGASILTGLGVRELSMSTRAIPRVKAEVRTLTMTQARSLANAALAAESSEAVRQLTAGKRDDDI
jgi:phosphocarrier protein FPr